MDRSATAVAFDAIDTWVFDLDNTLYSPDVRLFDQISEKMRHYIRREFNVPMAEADAMRADYWHKYGTTLAGLMAHHKIDPWHFLNDVHDIDFSVLSAAPDLASAIEALPGRKLIYTNGDKPYARRVLEARGLGHVFEELYGIEDAAFRPKPEKAAFDMVFASAGLTPTRATMFEDDSRNLTVPHALGMRTVLVHTEVADASHIHHKTADLTQFLVQIASSELS
ncbi:MAG: pyrimidine 5'-nucleotidase [Pseudomonadota bacterium]